jgi:hypothetical protein
MLPKLALIYCQNFNKNGIKTKPTLNKLRMGKNCYEKENINPRLEPL